MFEDICTVGHFPAAPIDDKKWVPDEALNSCTLCYKVFKITRRRHHCRRCGRVFCAKCSSGKYAFESGRPPARVCDLCMYLLSERKSWHYFWKLADLAEHADPGLQEAAALGFRNALATDGNRAAFWSSGLAQLVEIMIGTSNAGVLEHTLAALANFASGPLPEYALQVVRMGALKPLMRHVRSSHGAVQAAAAKALLALSRFYVLHPSLIAAGAVPALATALEDRAAAVTAEPILLAVLCALTHSPLLPDHCRLLTRALAPLLERLSALSLQRALTVLHRCGRWGGGSYRAVTWLAARTVLAAQPAGMDDVAVSTAPAAAQALSSLLLDEETARTCAQAAVTALATLLQHLDRLRKRPDAATLLLAVARALSAVAATSAGRAALDPHRPLLQTLVDAGRDDAEAAQQARQLIDGYGAALAGPAGAPGDAEAEGTNSAAPAAAPAAGSAAGPAALSAGAAVAAADAEPSPTVPRGPALVPDAEPAVPLSVAEQALRRACVQTLQRLQRSGQVTSPAFLSPVSS